MDISPKSLLLSKAHWSRILPSVHQKGPMYIYWECGERPMTKMALLTYPLEIRGEAVENNQQQPNDIHENGCVSHMSHWQALKWQWSMKAASSKLVHQWEFHLSSSFLHFTAEGMVMPYVGYISRDFEMNISMAEFWLWVQSCRPLAVKPDTTVKGSYEHRDFKSTETKI